MNYQACACRQFILAAALALALAPAGKPGTVHLDGKTAGVERVVSPPVPSNQNSGESQEATSQLNLTTASQPAAKSPQVTYANGQLTIIAENSSLSDVMKAVRAALGADIDLPARVVDQHIWVHLGPGPARRVLRDLLDSTEFNYVIQASENDPDGVRSVLLTARSRSEPGPPERAGIRMIPVTASDAQSSPDSESPAPEPVASVDPPPAPSPASPANASSNSARLQSTLGNAVSSALKPPTDPEQQIQQLQSMYELRRQLQMQQNQKAAGQN